MNQPKWFLHPLLIIIFSIIALVMSLLLYIYWYIEVSKGLKAVIQKFNIDQNQVLAPETWVVIMVLSILMGIILLGIFSIFAYNQKAWQLYRLQHNFINNFTHELKTPVTSLKLFLETFSKHELTRDDQLKYINFMLIDVNRLSDNISRILNLARIENKSYGGKFRQFDPELVIEQFLSKNSHLFQNCHIFLNNQTKRALTCRINLSMFEILLMNIITNAIKYNNSEQINITISMLCQKNRLYIAFKDNGIGFEKKEIKKIFRRFYQVGRAKQRAIKGSGIGLHLVQTIAKSHKGKVVAKSKGRGKGSTFILIMPYKGSSNDGKTSE